MADAKITQKPAIVEVDFEGGDDLPYDIAVSDDDGNAIDFSQHSDEVLRVRTSEGGQVLKEFKTSDGSLTTTAGGEVQCTFDDADTSTWPRHAFHEVESVDGNGDKRTWIEGQLTLD